MLYISFSFPKSWVVYRPRVQKTPVNETIDGGFVFSEPVT